MNWIISANSKMYDHAAAFQKWGFIDWRQRVKYTVGDIVYIYCTRPIQQIMYKTVVIKESMTRDEIVDDMEFWHISEEYEKALDGKYARLKLLSQSNNRKLHFSELKKYGLKTAPQGPVRVDKVLAAYIDKNVDDYINEDIFPDSDIPLECYEGVKHIVAVNRYERSSIARQRCIEENGARCFVCDFDFEKVYGEVGKDFIHIHHIVPIYEIGKEYIVDYRKDLIPVCPNCHAVLHRKYNNKYYKWKELRKIVKKGNI